MVFIERWSLHVQRSKSTAKELAFGIQPSGLYREVVSVQRSKSTAKELLGPNWVVFIERWSVVSIRQASSYVHNNNSEGDTSSSQYLKQLFDHDLLAHGFNWLYCHSPGYEIGSTAYGINILCVGIPWASHNISVPQNLQTLLTTCLTPLKRAWSPRAGANSPRWADGWAVGWP